MTNKDLNSILARIHESIRAADQKISVFLALQSALFIISSVALVKFYVQHYDHLKGYDLAILVAAVSLVMYSLFKLLFALKPRLEHRQPASLIYFGAIASMDLKSYSKALSRATEADLKRDLIAQIHNSAVIAKKKHIQISEAVWVFLAGACMLILHLTIFATR